MSSICSSADAPRSAGEVNERIRTFMATRLGQPLWPEEQEEYERLLEAWAAATRGELIMVA
ncbi:hypothetical protein ADK76_28895 [Streptomyces griseoflavus]|uniref:hypothetical protein n=1 Tax=Streptomyces rimosus TaxID=1927 RepID=UPI0004CC2DAD|nr:hypothetical protein [Streptomyces rimosus]KOG53134.1 hypothetical protein ADK76_28895 [Streptomyces griseoflavus]